MDKQVWCAIKDYHSTHHHRPSGRGTTFLFLGSFVDPDLCPCITIRIDQVRNSPSLCIPRWRPLELGFGRSSSSSHLARLPSLPLSPSLAPAKSYMFITIMIALNCAAAKVPSIASPPDGRTDADVDTFCLLPSLPSSLRWVIGLRPDFALSQRDDRERD